MGLTKTNYTVKTIELTLPRVYAVIKDLKINGNIGTAAFYIQTTRDNAFNKQPIEIKNFQFNVNRNENPYVTAYEAAKSQIEYEETDAQGNTVKRTFKNIFYGWEDDIIPVEEPAEEVTENEDIS